MSLAACTNGSPTIEVGVTESKSALLKGFKQKPSRFGLRGDFPLHSNSGE